MNPLVRLWRQTRAPQTPHPRPTAETHALFTPSLRVDTNPRKRNTEQLDSFAGYVYAAVNTLATDVATTPWRILNKTGDRPTDWAELPKHPALLTPNNLMTDQDLLELWSIHRDLTGNAFIQIIGTRDRVDGLQILYPNHVETPILNARGTDVTHWRVRVAGRTTRDLPARDIIFDRYQHPFDPFRGASPVEAFAISYDMDLYTRAYGASLMRGHAVPPIVLTSNSERLTPEQADLIRERWKDRYGGVSAEEIAVLPRGATVQQLAFPMKDLAFLDMARLSKDQILEIYKVPPAKLGNVPNGISRGGAEAVEHTYNQNALLPRLKRIERAMNAHVIPRLYPNHPRAEFAFKNVVTEDKQRQFDNAHRAFARGALTLGDYLEAIEQPRPRGQDAEYRFVPLNIQIARDLKEGITGQPANTPQHNPPGQNEDGGNPNNATPDPQALPPETKTPDGSAPLEASIALAATRALHEAATRTRYHTLRAMFAGMHQRDKQHNFRLGLDPHELRTNHINPLDERLARAPNETPTQHYERLKSSVARALARE